MQGLIDFIRKIVVIVLLLELVMQLQPGKNYEPYLKMFVGLFLVYSLISGLSGGVLQGGFDAKLPTYTFNWSIDATEETRNGMEKIEIPTNRIEIEKIEIERIGNHQ